MHISIQNERLLNSLSVQILNLHYKFIQTIDFTNFVLLMKCEIKVLLYLIDLKKYIFKQQIPFLKYIYYFFFSLIFSLIILFTICSIDLYEI